ncbi:xanthine dehydrogenase family protein molybdopterin-binding subunit [Falsigemmobacter faecalis]|uniref:Xanthine dehydrogenase family protein molybdopterin-binding subunit n=1 Tax=Falsigemmobacter faecalis TaxID=2488730 RepID=A0A3P3DRC1_9RHOB|nr:xanthine dehydrogenase family protein molybdopterin-binding subunit [Falsigemmobacter faecalis]RRH76226.1 xanthine dehydrogenase family protein molybdopterin-binding subunit [Falsigemmobacter faecalis]
MTRADPPLPRLDALEKVTGRANYAADLQPQGVLQAFALRATRAPARIRSIDCENARAVPGVVAVYTHENAHETGWRADPALDALFAEGLGRSALKDAASQLPAYRPLTSDEVMFAGQWIAIVVAEGIEAARQGLAAVQVNLEDLPPPEPVKIRPGPFFAGDMQHAFTTGHRAGAPRHRVEASYETPVQLHQPLEPSATTAVWQGGRVILRDSTQGTRATRTAVAASLGVAEENVLIHAEYVGGGFGAKNQIWPHQALAAHLSRALQRPVRLQLTRADLGVASGHRSETRQHIRLEADADGRLALLTHHSEIPTSLRGGFFEPCGLSSLMLYAAQRIEVRHEVTRRAIPTPTPFRAPGETPGSFALETALDELAHQAGIDPVELRLRNFAERDLYHNRPWSSNHLAECYARGAARIGWAGRSALPRRHRRDGRLVGLGMATTAYPAPILPASVRVTLRGTGSVLVETSATDIGTGMRSLLAQKVADTLGISPAEIEVQLGRSELPDAPTAGRSKSSASVMPAAGAAARALLQKLGPEERSNLTLAQRLAALGQPHISAEGHSAPRDPQAEHSFYSFGAHFVEVELEEQIGRLRVTRVVSVLDCGTILHPRLAESQIRGGVIFGIGMALMEEGLRHPATGRLISDNLADYAIPVHADVPEIEVDFLNIPDPLMGEDGARGLGEIGLPGLAAAIGNAVFNASGRRIRQTPFPLSALTG